MMFHTGGDKKTLKTTKILIFMHVRAYKMKRNDYIIIIG